MAVEKESAIEIGFSPENAVDRMWMTGWESGPSSALEEDGKPLLRVGDSVSLSVLGQPVTDIDDRRVFGNGVALSLGSNAALYVVVQQGRISVIGLTNRP